MSDFIDKVYVCQRCEVRLSKTSDFKGVGFSWTPESFKELKLGFIKKFGKKPKKNVVMTSCLGYCPDDSVAYEESENGQVSEAQKYPADLDREGVFKLLFK
jgi:hypothetical protein